MGIGRIEIKDYGVFKSKFFLDFCKGINVIIGGNGTGKTTLLRVMYRESIRDKIRIFKLNEIQDIANYRTPWKIAINNNDTDIIQKVFIPENDMLSHSKGLLPLWNERILPFWNYEIDILAKAQLPETRLIKSAASIVINKIEEIIGGEVLYEEDEFFTKKNNGDKIPFNLEASGYRKFGLLWKLLRNGLLEEGSVLFWDEPENSLNPELIPILVEILLELSNSGVQIFLATHNYELARYFDIRKNKAIPVMFHNLSKTNDGKIVCDSSSRYVKLPNNLMEKAGEKLYNAVIADALEVQNNE